MVQRIGMPAVVRAVANAIVVNIMLRFRAPFLATAKFKASFVLLVWLNENVPMENAASMVAIFAVILKLMEQRTFSFQCGIGL